MEQRKIMGRSTDALCFQNCLIALRDFLVPLSAPGKGNIMRVLLVDDNRRMRDFLKSMLEEPGLQFCEAADGAQAVSIYEAISPDLVLMDIRMPVMDGLEATRRIVRSDPKARVIIVTDFDLPEYRIEAQVAGAEGFVSKRNLFELRGKVKGKETRS
jgi:CheY-like chemotaxis protein